MPIAALKCTAKAIAHFTVPLSLLISCNNAIGAPVALEKTLKTAILFIKDQALKKCITHQISQNKWVSIQHVTQLKCHSKSIASLDGIEAFHAITKASFFNNNIQQYSIKGLSNLNHLNLAKNPLLSLSLTHTKLEQLYVFSTDMHTLILDLPSVQIVRANNNQLVHFSYRNLNALKKLYLFDNQLEAMDIHQLPNLSFMDVRQNPMPDSLYDDMDTINQATVFHDGNAEDWN